MSLRLRSSTWPNDPRHDDFQILEDEEAVGNCASPKRHYAQSRSGDGCFRGSLRCLEKSCSALDLAERGTTVDGNSNSTQKLPSALSEVRMNKKAEEILNGFDRIVEKTEAMPVTPEEKRRLIKEWLRSRLAEMAATGAEAK